MALAKFSVLQPLRKLEVTKTAAEEEVHRGVSKNSGTPKSSILIGFSIINHPFWGTPIFGNTYRGKGY